MLEGGGGGWGEVSDSSVEHVRRLRGERGLWRGAGRDSCGRDLAETLAIQVRVPGEFRGR